MKKYRYSDFEKDGWSSQNRFLIYSGIFTFTEIGDAGDKESETKIRIETPESMITGWKANSKQANPSDDDLIKVLSGIAKEDGLKKGVKLIKVNEDTYPEGIGKFEEYGMEEGCEFTIQSPTSLEEIKELWRQEPDSSRVFRAATEDIEEYPPEVQAVIKEEAKRRREAKPQRNTIPKQKKVKIYRVLGGILCVLGFFGSLSHALQSVLEEGMIVLSYSGIVDALFGFVINIFLWAGLILLWRADKNENPDKKSKWLKLIKVYLVISLIIIIGTLAFPVFVRVAHIWLSRP